MDEEVRNGRLHAGYVPFPRRVLEIYEIALAYRLPGAIRNLDLEIARHVDSKLFSRRGVPVGFARQGSSVSTCRHARDRNLPGIVRDLNDADMRFTISRRKDMDQPRLQFVA